MLQHRPDGRMTIDPMTDAQLDATGLKCPIPVLKARKVIKDLKVGETLEVLATDPGSVADFEAFCATGGYQLLEQNRNGDIFRFLIRVNAEIP